MYFSSPTQSFGYYRGTPYYGGEGAGTGGIVAGTGVFSAGQGPQQASGSAWNPTILYLFVLVLAEMFIFAWIGRHI
jgi:hypothetical protein